MLITPSYRDLNTVLHLERPSYGAGGVKYADQMRALMTEFNCKTALDYGCGKGYLVESLGCAGYDPAVPQYSAMPKPADLVICMDVMEHVEEDCVPEVIVHIFMLAQKIAWFDICTRPAQKTLPDGRNAHVTLWPWKQWVVALSEYCKEIDVRRLEEGKRISMVCHVAR